MLGELVVRAMFCERGNPLLMTNSSNGEDVYSTLLETLIRDIYTPYQWEGFKRISSPTSSPYRDLQ